MLGINYVNDLHLGFHCKISKNQIKYEKSVREYANKLISNSKKGEILIIAGDFGEDNKSSYWFLDEVSKSYEKVIITYGNHDLYMLTNNQRKKYKKNSLNKVNKLYEKVGQIPNVHFLGEDFDGILEYKGKKIGGDIMMSVPKTDEEISFYNSRMSDSRYINMGYYKHENPEYLNKKNIEYYNSLKGKLDIFVSHYPIITTDSHIMDSKESLGSYRTDVDELISDINFFGHVHERGSYEITGKMFYTHAIGYPGEGYDDSFGYLKV